MKNLLFIAATVLSISTATAQTAQDKAAEKEVAALERKRFDAQVKKDYPYLEKVFADDLVYTHGSGLRNNKTEYIQSIRDGKSKYGKIDVDDLKVRAYNDGKAAVVDGLITISQLQPKADGTPDVAHIKYVVVQIKDPKKGWQVVEWQAQKQAQ